MVQQGNQLIQVPNQPGVIIRPQSIEALNPEGGGKATVYYIPVQLPSENGAVFHGGSHVLVSNGVPPTRDSANLLVTPLRENKPPLLVTPRPDEPSPSQKSDLAMLVTPLPGTTTSSYPDPRKMRSSTQEDKSRSLDSKEEGLESNIEDGDLSEGGGQWMSRVSFNMGVSSPSGPVRRRHHNNPGKIIN